MKDKHDYPSDLYYTRQYVRNACGTVALLHAVFNNKDIKLADDSVLKNFYDKSIGATPEERGRLLEQDTEFIEVHQALALEGQSSLPTVSNHFVALVNHNGTLFELDGRKNFPINHGSTNDDTFLNDAANVCKEFMIRDASELHFSILALAASP